MKAFLFWILALVITLSSAIYQRMTGPTHPTFGTVQFNNSDVDYYFYRSQGGTVDHLVSIIDKDTTITATLFWKRYKTNDEWIQVVMKSRNDSLVAYLPNQPPAGKLEYYVKISNGIDEINLPKDNSVVIRYKGAVPDVILIIHIIFMFTAMLLSVRTGIEAFRKEPKLYTLTYCTLITLFIGGLILGPIVQQYAFGALWTGIPFGHDLTDNKTLIIFVGWVIALFMYKKSAHPERWAIAASVLMIAIYLIPHSTLGSEIDYNKLDKEKAKQEQLENSSPEIIDTLK
ncbi:MAG: hypothetical protein KKF62_07875 [Bacteroidetes bacterium]|nr:hypothetical protein [Bacteroidota bacterium]MBU1115935.1 hypothetical protein [Bacteroidota bacterium]MBU1798468.1 hypothetical protein [Bacteroidota bacterium]